MDLSPGRIRRGLRNLIHRELFRDRALIAAHRWKRDRAQQRILHAFPLKSGDIVIDIGGYRGDFAAEMVDRYGARVHLFEPVRAFYEHCLVRFASEPLVKVHPFALGASDAMVPIADAADASSLHVAASNSTEIVEVREAGAAVAALGIDRIGLIKMNIEGAEYEVLPALLDSGIVAKTRFLLIQFHTVGDYEVQRSALRARLRETHEEMWCYDFVWEAWQARA